MANKTKMSKDEVKAYQRTLKEVNLYDGLIDGDYGPKTTEASNVYEDLSEKGYTKSQIYRHSIGAPHMPDKHWSLYQKHGKDYKKFIPIEDSIIDTLKGLE